MFLIKFLSNAGFLFGMLLLNLQISFSKKIFLIKSELLLLVIEGLVGHVRLQSL